MQDLDTVLLVLVVQLVDQVVEVEEQDALVDVKQVLQEILPQ